MHTGGGTIRTFFVEVYPPRAGYAHHSIDFYPRPPPSAAH